MLFGSIARLEVHTYSNMTWGAASQAPKIRVCRGANSRNINQPAALFFIASFRLDTASCEGAVRLFALLCSTTCISKYMTTRHALLNFRASKCKRVVVSNDPFCVGGNFVSHSLCRAYVAFEIVTPELFEIFVHGISGVVGVYLRPVTLTMPASSCGASVVLTR